MVKADEERAKRLAAALRENLRRRKAQARNPPRNGEGDRDAKRRGGGGGPEAQNPLNQPAAGPPLRPGED
jgi:hypothetical protein